MTTDLKKNVIAVVTPEWAYTPVRPGRRYPPLACELGYSYDTAVGKCVGKKIKYLF